MRDWFHRFAARVAEHMGSPIAFFLAMLVLVAWAVTGPIFGFSDTWQLVINTGTTIVTFLMVFLIQNTQNRDAKAIHLKLDELLRGVEGARTSMVDLEDLPDAELTKMQCEFQELRKRQVEIEREHDALAAEHEELEREHDALEREHDELERGIIVLHPEFYAAHPKPVDNEPKPDKDTRD
jgi:low affinity Fe/Cu permease